MTWLVLGVLLWVGAHLFKRVLPKQREALGKWGRPLVAAPIVETGRCYRIVTAFEHGVGHTVGDVVLHRYDCVAV